MNYLHETIINIVYSAGLKRFQFHGMGGGSDHLSLTKWLIDQAKEFVKLYPSTNQDFDYWDEVDKFIEKKMDEAVENGIAYYDIETKEA